jgi:hypothetical protein
LFEPVKHAITKQIGVLEHQSTSSALNIVPPVPLYGWSTSVVRTS